MIAIGRSVQRFSHRLMKYVNSCTTKTCTAMSTSFNGCSEIASCAQGRRPYSSSRLQTAVKSLTSRHCFVLKETRAKNVLNH